ncbi:hypothetical protein L2E82_32726 [Cichorium intybus]|uniref:Uncharacterized protein n=1 Tax=Cichorium intybus TaxID=13427 RepID=A0ACB9BHZ5_CICIN|nr:hypothetical protein L2E82_32726 [Cichorium intybus]
MKATPMIMKTLNSIQDLTMMDGLSLARETLSRLIENTHVSSPKNNKHDKQEAQKSKSDDREPKIVKASNNLETEKELKFRALTGGLRNKAGASDVFFNDGSDTDSGEEVVSVPKPKPTELSRRTKSYVEP